MWPFAYVIFHLAEYFQEFDFFCILIVQIPYQRMIINASFYSGAFSLLIMSSEAESSFSFGDSHLFLLLLLCFLCFISETIA